MNALAIIALYQGVLRSLPESNKREIDAKFKVIEDKFKQGSPLDIAMEIGMMVLRGDVIIDYPDGANKKEIMMDMVKSTGPNVPIPPTLEAEDNPTSVISRGIDWLKRRG